MTARLPLRDQLLALRRDALARLAKSDQIDNGTLRLMADTSAALAALEAETIQAIAPIPEDRAVVLDDNLRPTGKPPPRSCRRLQPCGWRTD